MSGKHGPVLTAAGWLLAMMMLGGILLATPDEAAAIKLNPPLVAGGAVLDVQLTPDGTRVVYLADQETNGVAELYSVPVSGGPATKLNKPLVAGGAVKAFNLTPDGSRVVFMADQDFNDIVEIYSVPVAGWAGHATERSAHAPGRGQRQELSDHRRWQPGRLPGGPGHGRPRRALRRSGGGRSTDEAERPRHRHARARCSHSRSRRMAAGSCSGATWRPTGLIELYSAAMAGRADHEAQSRRCSRRMSPASRSPRVAAMWCTGQRRTTKRSSSSTSCRSRAAAPQKLNGPLPAGLPGQRVSVHARRQPGGVSRPARDRATAAGRGDRHHRDLQRRRGGWRRRRS